LSQEWCGSLVIVEGEVFDIYCIVDNEFLPFKIPVSPSNDIADLKKFIQREREPGILHGVDPYLLKLWKLNDPVRVRPEESLRERMNSGSDMSYFARKLESSDQVCQHFLKEDPNTRIKIFVTITAQADLIGCQATTSVPPKSKPSAKDGNSVSKPVESEEWIPLSQLPLSCDRCKKYVKPTTCIIGQFDMRCTKCQAEKQACYWDGRTRTDKVKTASASKKRKLDDDASTSIDGIPVAGPSRAARPLSSKGKGKNEATAVDSDSSYTDVIVDKPSLRAKIAAFKEVISDLQRKVKLMEREL